MKNTLKATGRVITLKVETIEEVTNKINNLIERRTDESCYDNYSIQTVGGGCKLLVVELISGNDYNSFLVGDEQKLYAGRYENLRFDGDPDELLTDKFEEWLLFDDGEYVTLNVRLLDDLNYCDYSEEDYYLVAHIMLLHYLQNCERDIHELEVTYKEYQQLRNAAIDNFWIASEYIDDPLTTVEDHIQMIERTASLLDRGYTAYLLANRE